MANMDAMNWQVYIILCSDATLYTGITNDIARRYSRHAASRGARYFRGRRPTRVVYLESGQVWLFQDSGGYYAVDAICTHLGCTVYAQPDSSFQCRCHGSQFAADGRVLVGPATVPLRFLQLSWDGGRLVVDRALQVDPSVRLSA